MPLTISGLIPGARQTRDLLGRLAAAGLPMHVVTIVHGGEAEAPSAPLAGAAEAGSATGIAAGAAGAAAGAFGWLVGFGVLALPAAALGGALAAGVAAAAESARPAPAPAPRQPPESLLRRYRERLIGDQVAVFIQAEDARGYDLVTQALDAVHAEDIQAVGRGRMEPVHQEP